jgi:phage terminase small subunit
MPAHRKSTNFLLLSGGLKKNPGRYADRLNQPKPAGAIGEPPSWLDDIERQEWANTIAEAPPGVLTNADRGIVELIALLRGMVTKRTADSKTMALLRQCLGECGMTPSSRNRVQVVPPAEGNNPFNAFSSV